MRNLVFLACIAGCSSSGDVITARQLPAAMQADAAAIAQANNAFACDLYMQLAGEAGNVFASPFSISTALAMVDAGAAGTSDAELRKALHFTLPGERTHAAYGALLASLDAGRSFGKYTLAMANRLFGQQGVPFVQDFLDVTRRAYGAELMPVDFRGNLDAARHTINGWVAAQTDHAISELFAAGSLDPQTVLELVNAIVFKGTWSHEFDRAATAERPFHRADGTDVQVQMMRKHDDVPHAAIPGGDLLLLPFAGEDLSMVLLVPSDRAGLPTIEAALSGPALAQWIAEARPAGEPGELFLPKFAITSSVDLAAPLEQLGISSAFIDGVADFSPIDGRRDLFLTQIVHRAVITVDEHGATAAAATGAGIGATSAPASIIVDRPFVFAIYDHVTGSVLFLGRLADPTA